MCAFAVPEDPCIDWWVDHGRNDDTSNPDLAFRTDDGRRLLFEDWLERCLELGGFLTDASFGLKLAKLSTRNIPSSVRIPGIRGVESSFADDAWDTYQARISEVLDADFSPTELHAAIDDALQALESELTALAPTYLYDAYQRGSEAVFEGFEFTDADEQLLATIMEDETGIVPAIQNFVSEHAAGMHAAVDESVFDGQIDEELFDAKRDDLEDVAWSKFELFARTEVTKASNWGRSVALEATGAGAVEWVTAADERVCPVCMGLADGSPYDFDQLIGLTDGTLSGHPGCRCTIGGISYAA